MELEASGGLLLLASNTGHRSDRGELGDNCGKKTVRMSEQVGERVLDLQIPAL